jgi:hypothetical protein
MQLVRLGYIVGLVALLVVPATPGVAGQLASHRAIYTLMLASATGGSGVAAVHGEMAVDWAETCAGWTFEHKSVMDVIFSGRPSVRLTTSASTWEARNGREYRFVVRNLTNGKVAEKIEGRALLEAPGGPGRAEFTAPRRMEMALPAGTAFPAGHSEIVLRHADASAPGMVSRVVFDGMTADGAFDISAALGKPKRGKDLSAAAVALENRRYWPITLAYYPIGDIAVEPKHEISMRLYDNGIADEMLLDIGQFVVRANIAKLEIRPSPKCDG